jgi:hypothetical protein
MGTYTGLRFTARLKATAAAALRDAYRERIEKHDDPEYDDEPFWVTVRKKGLPISDDFIAYGRSSFIPFGAVAYMPRDWESAATLEGDSWSVCCSYKDIGYHPIPMTDVFLNSVLPMLISEECIVECRYEEWENPIIQTVFPEQQILLEVPHES